MVDADTIFDSGTADAVTVAGASAVSADMCIDVAVEVVQYCRFQINAAVCRKGFAQQEAAAQNNAVHAVVSNAHSIVASGYGIIIAAQMYVACTHHRFNEPAVIQILTIAVFNSKAYSCTAKITVQFLGNSAAVSAGFTVNFTNFGNDVYMMTFIASPCAI